MSRRQKIRRNSICECGCGRKFKICNVERLEKEAEERRIAWRKKMEEDSMDPEKSLRHLQLQSALALCAFYGVNK